MNRIKQRIIGAIVLVSLAVIFVPMLFEAPHPDRVQTPVTIPPAPEVPGYKVQPLPAPPLPAAPQAAQSLPAITGYSDGMEQGSRDEPEASPESGTADIQSSNVGEVAKPVTAKHESPAGEKEKEKVIEAAPAAASAARPAMAKNSPEAFWKVKVGTFSKRDNAIRLRDALRNEGIKAWTEPMVTAKGETWLRVWAGPVVSKEEAEKLSARIDKQWKTRSRIVKTRS